MSMFTTLWEHRSFIGSLVSREVQVRSARAVWGNIWLVLEPATQILIYTLVFGRVLGARLGDDTNTMSYGIYICSGILTWNFFQEIVARSQTLFLEHAAILKAVHFPRAALPVALLASAGFNFAIVAGIFLCVLAATGNWPGWALLGVVPLLIIQIAIAGGLGILTGTINVFFRDTSRIVSILMQFWFWLTPIVYPRSIVPEAMAPLYDWNPMVPIVEGYHSIVLDHAAPPWQEMVAPTVAASLLLVIGWFVFRKLSPDLVDEL